MANDSDPFRHHPELRGQITDPADSFFRNFDPAQFDEIARKHGMREDWRYPDDVRNRMFDAFLASLPQGDLWVFGYGSLIWDPGAHFTELRKAYAPGYSRRFILVDDGARGSPEQPAVMAALDHGDGCEGVALRLAADTLREELEHIWRREKIAPAYDATMIDIDTDQGPLCALTFTANHDSPDIDGSISFENQVQALATAKGILGNNFEYVENLKRQFDVLGISDPHVDRLHEAARSRALSLGLLD